MFFCGWFVAPSTRILTQFDTAAVSDLKPNTIKGIGEKQGLFSETLTDNARDFAHFGLGLR